MDRHYYPCKIQLHGQNHFLIWYEDDCDGFLRVPGGRLFRCPTLTVLMTGAQEQNVVLESTDPAVFDFEQLARWCESPCSDSLCYEAFLNAWNCFDDLAGLHTGIESEYCRLSTAACGCYDKLFWGNNLPSLTPPEKHFVPTWSAQELQTLSHVWKVGLKMLTTELHHATVPTDER